MENVKNKDCCSVKTKNVNGFWSGLLYAIIPHSFCILFVVFSIIGATFATQVLRQFLLLPYFMPMLIGLSLLFALISAIFYLRRINSLSWEGIVAKRNYLIILFSTTIIVNILFFNYVMPIVGGIKPINTAIQNLETRYDVSPDEVFSKTSNEQKKDLPKNTSGDELSNGKQTGFDNTIEAFDISVDLPCSGHAFLVTGDLEKLGGVESVEFYSSNKFKIKFDPSVISRAQILGLDIFKTYKATEI
ncbi:MAG: hypothetical protein WCX74_02180 [Candidatus Paceibacterota bacterium]